MDLRLCREGIRKHLCAIELLIGTLDLYLLAFSSSGWFQTYFLFYQKKCLVFPLICLQTETCITLFSGFNFLPCFISLAQRHSFLIFDLFHFLHISYLILEKICLYLVNFHLIVKFREIFQFIWFLKPLCFFTYEFLMQKISEFMNIQHFSSFYFLVLLLQVSLDQFCYLKIFDFIWVIEFNDLNFINKEILCLILTNYLKLVLISQ